MKNSNSLPIFTKAFTHGGVFHADDVFSSALLMILFPEIIIMRGFTVPEDFSGIVFDIGMGEFDHHQADRRVRENGVPYAAFGLLWEKFGEFILNKEDVEEFDQYFVQPIDMSDNTGSFCAMADAVRHMNPNWNEDIDLDERFLQAVNWAKFMLQAYFDQMNAKREAYEWVTSKIKDAKNGILYLEELRPWKAVLAKEDIYFVIYPSLRGGYNVQAVPISPEERELKKGFPQIWRGKCNQELANITGVPGATFCHNSGFLAAVQTLEDAYDLADKALNF